MIQSGKIGRNNLFFKSIFLSLKPKRKTKKFVHVNTKMPQVFQVLKCYKCFIFQIHQTKKSNKFECKVCGEKQSIKRHYGIGTGKDCRMHVQKLNVLRGNFDAEPSIKSSSDEENEDNENDEEISHNSKTLLIQYNEQSKWTTYVDKNEEIETTEEPMFIGNRELLLEIPKKRKITKTKDRAQETNSEHLFRKYPSVVELKSNTVSSIENKTDNLGIDIPVTNDISRNNDVISASNKQLKYNNLNNIIEGNPPEPVVSQTINENSKWAQFLDPNEDKIDMHNDKLTNCEEKNCVSTIDNIFSLCDDNDIDRVLDI